MPPSPSAALLPDEAQAQAVRAALRAAVPSALQTDGPDSRARGCQAARDRVRPPAKPGRTTKQLSCRRRLRAEPAPAAAGQPRLRRLRPQPRRRQPPPRRHRRRPSLRRRWRRTCASTAYGRACAEAGRTCASTAAGEPAPQSQPHLRLHRLRPSQRRRLPHLRPAACAEPPSETAAAPAPASSSRRAATGVPGQPEAGSPAPGNPVRHRQRHARQRQLRDA